MFFTLDLKQCNQWSITHTPTTKNNNYSNTNHQRSQGYSQFKFSHNEVSVVLSFSASPNTFTPSAPISFTTATPEWRDPNNQFSKPAPMSYAVCKAITATAASTLDT
jgi:hypothetical protein